MNKKVLVIIGLACVIALSTGVIAYFGTRSSSDTDKEPAPTEAVTEYEDDTQPATEEEPPSVTEPVPTEAQTDAPTEADNRDPYGYTDLLVSADTYRIRRVFDHTTGGEVTAREVFGKLYSYCSLSFADDGTFELCINPTSGETRTGYYEVYGDEIFAEYKDGKGTEFRIITDTPGEISYILVNYGDYDVYFG